MQKIQKTTTKPSAASEHKKVKIDQAQSAKSKTSSLIKKVLKLVKQNNQEIYICLRDKKTKKVLQFSSNVPEFNLDEIKELTKKCQVQSTEKLNEQMIELEKDKEPIQEQNDVTIESKKNTSASSSEEQKSDEMSKEEPCLLERYPLDIDYDVNNIKDGIFDHKSHLEFKDHKLSALLKPEYLSFANIQNEMSYQDPRHCNDSLFGFSNINLDEVESCFNEEQRTEMKTFQEEDFGLRFESKRAGFANKYLFKQTSQVYEDQEEDEEEEDYTYNEESYCSDEFSTSTPQADPFCSSTYYSAGQDLSEPMQPVKMTPQSSVQSVKSAPQAPITSQEPVQVGEFPSHDMFFSCCDWETAMEIEKKFMTVPKKSHDLFDDCEESLKEKAKTNKRELKITEKIGLTVSKFEDQFDVDLVMNKVAGHNQTEKVVSTKKYTNKCKRRNLKKRTTDPTSQSSIDSTFTTQDKNKEVKTDLYQACLSPLNESTPRLSFNFQMQNTK